MSKTIDGVDFVNHDSYGLFHIHHISDELKDIIRRNLTSICHGSAHSKTALYGYKPTLKSFLNRYDSKAENTKKGMICEYLAHLCITESYENLRRSFELFNHEEKSLKKVFNLIVYDSVENGFW